MRVSIAGSIGGGKSTVARIIADRIGIQPKSTGTLQREWAISLGIDAAELNRMAEQDPTIDEKIDGFSRSITDDKLVIESRMAWHFVPSTFKVFLYVPDIVGAKRVLSANRRSEFFASLEDAIKSVNERHNREMNRFKNKYGVDISDLANYNFVIDATYEEPEFIADLIIKYAAINNHHTLISPKNLFPTQSMRQINPSLVDEIYKSSSRPYPSGIQVIYFKNRFFVFDGHHRLATALKYKLSYVDVNVIGINDVGNIQGLSGEKYLNESISLSLLYDWEEAFNFYYDPSLMESFGNNGTMHSGGTGSR